MKNSIYLLSKYRGMLGVLQKMSDFLLPAPQLQFLQTSFKEHAQNFKNQPSTECRETKQSNTALGIIDCDAKRK